jgi:AcrR family transcriptional regulator
MSTTRREPTQQRRREPVQRRSREKVDQILEAAAELISQGGVDELTTRAVAERSGVPIPTLYRYFANCDEIVAAFLDREMVAIDAEVAAAVLSLDRVTLRSMMEAAALAHLRHHQRNPMAISLWFGGRHSAVVRDRVRWQDKRLAESFTVIIDAAGFLRDDSPQLGPELLVRLTDRMFEFVLLEYGGSPEEQERIVHGFVDMIASFSERYATVAGAKGISGEQFRRLVQANDGLFAGTPA